MAAYSSRQLETPVGWLNRRAKLANCPAKSKAPGERYCSRAGSISAPLAHTSCPRDLPLSPAPQHARRCLRRPTAR